MTTPNTIGKQSSEIEITDQQIDQFLEGTLNTERDANRRILEDVLNPTGRVWEYVRKKDEERRKRLDRIFDFAMRD